MFESDEFLLKTYKRHMEEGSDIPEGMEKTFALTISKKVIQDL